jgi:hypothetical protein
MTNYTTHFATIRDADSRMSFIQSKALLAAQRADAEERRRVTKQCAQDAKVMPPKQNGVHFYI